MTEIVVAFQIHYVEPESRTIHNKVLKRAQLVPFFANRPASRVVMEACGNAYYWARVLARLGHDVRLIAAQFVRPFVKFRARGISHALVCRSQLREQQLVQAIPYARSLPIAQICQLKGPVI